MTKMQWLIIGGLAIAAFAMFTLLGCLVLGMIFVPSRAVPIITVETVETIQNGKALPTSTLRPLVTPRPQNQNGAPVLKEHSCLVIKYVVNQICFASIENPTNTIIG